MAKLALDIQNYLRQQPDLTDLVGKSKSFPSWIWADKPLGKIEGTGMSAPERSALVVISEGTNWTTPNEHNTSRVPRVFVDVWADPTRNSNGDVMIPDADIKIDRIHRVISKYLHLVDNGDRKGKPICWGTAEEMATYRGSLITGSSRANEPAYADVANGNGARMAAVTYNIIWA